VLLLLPGCDRLHFARPLPLNGWSSAPAPVQSYALPGKDSRCLESCTRARGFTIRVD
jgi:hypothetical protein